MLGRTRVTQAEIGVTGMENHVFLLEVLIAAIGAALGAAFQTMVSAGGPKYHVEDVKAKKGTIHVGDETIKVTNDNRVFIDAAALSGIAKSGAHADTEHLRLELERERKRSDDEKRSLERRLRQMEAQKNNNDGSETAWLQIGAVLLGGLLFIWLYLQYRPYITSIVSSLAVLAISFSMAALLSMIVRSVRLGWAVGVQLALNIVFSLASLLGLTWLDTPLAGGDLTDRDRLLTEHAPPISELVDEYDFELLVAVGYQGAGAVLLSLSLALIFLHVLIVWATIGYAVRVRLKGPHPPSRFRRWVMTQFRGPHRIWWTAIAVTLLALLLTSGLAWTWISAAGEAWSFPQN